MLAEEVLAETLSVEICEAWGVVFENNVKEIAEEDDFEMPNDTDETDIVIGDLFEIGQHRLLCGDSTNTEHFVKLMQDEIPEMVFADPPYGVEIVSKNSSTVGGGGETKFKGKVGGSKVVEAKEYDACMDFF